MIQLKIERSDADAWIQSVQNDKFQSAIKGNWILNDEAQVRAQSVLWLYCWAVTGMGSIETAIEVQEVFDQIFPFTYNFFKSKVDHEWARENRYSTRNIEADLEKLIKA